MTRFLKSALDMVTARDDSPETLNDRERVMALVALMGWTRNTQMCRTPNQDCYMHPTPREAGMVYVYVWFKRGTLTRAQRVVFLRGRIAGIEQLPHQPTLEQIESWLNQR